MKAVLNQSSGKNKAQSETKKSGAVKVSATNMAEQARIERNEFLLKEVGKMAKIGGWEIDLNTMTPYWSEAVYDIHEIPYSQEPVVDNIYQFYEDEYKPVAREAISRAIEFKESFDKELRFITAKGRKIWVRVMGKPVLDENGKVVALRGVFQDIDVEKKAKEAANMAHEELLSLYIATTHVSIIYSDINGTIIHFNKGAQNLLGYTAKEVIGKYTMEIFHLQEEIEERAKELSAKYHRRIEGFNVFVEIARHRSADAREWTYVRKNGKKFPVQLVVTAVKDFQGNITGFLSIATDVSMVKQAEKALIESEHKYRKIFENVQDVFYQADAHGIVTDISPPIEKYSGYAREKIIGSPVTDFYYFVEDRHRLLEALKMDGSVNDFEVRLKTKDGQLRYASVNARLLQENNQIIGAEGSMRDITLRKQHEDQLKVLNAKLEALNEQKNKLFSVIAHDLRNPISGSLSLLELAFMDIETNTKEELVEYLVLMRNATSNANELLEDLLQWAKTQFNSVSFDPIRIDDLARLINNCIKKIRPLAEKKNILISENVAQNISLSADKNMLDTVLRNLVTNAVKFTKPGGNISITAEENGHDIKFIVTDTGVGIPAKAIDKLFDKTSTYTSYGTDGEKGTGLGLDLCFDFVERHGGKIWVESTEGKGSSFYFTIPAMRDLPPAQ
jgi:PAS domain S-box-containing protein